MDANPFQSPRVEARELGPVGSFWRAMGRGAIWGAGVGFALMALLLAAMIGFAPSRRDGAEVVVQGIVLLPALAFVGSLFGAVFAAFSVWIRRWRVRRNARSDAEQATLPDYP
jgi:hypothetical protein